MYIVLCGCLYTINRGKKSMKIEQTLWIFVINNGKIAEEGTYSDLIEKNGLFKGLVEGQV